YDLEQFFDDLKLASEELSEHDAGKICFSSAQTRSPAHLASSFIMVNIVMNQMYEGLRSVLYLLLKNPQGHDKLLDYLAQVINKNGARARINVNPFKCASSAWLMILRKPSRGFRVHINLL
ncbi:hypothetical protein KI387_014317, partial [Taxus chinensis]